MKRIVSATAQAGFQVELTFDDNVRGVVDLSHLVGKGVFAAWNDPQEFSRVGIGPSGDLVWPCGVDLCPDSLYLRVTGQRAQDLLPGLSGEVRCA